MEQELDILIRELTVAGFQIGPKKSASLEDFYECKKDYVRFDIVVTEEEAFIYSSNKEAINILMEIFK